MKNARMLAFAAIAVFSTQIAMANLPLTERSNTDIAELVIDGFLEIETSTLPKEVSEAVTTKFEGSEISKAYVNKEGIYKLDLTKADTQTTVYMNAKGELVDL